MYCFETYFLLSQERSSIFTKKNFCGFCCFLCDFVFVFVLEAAALERCEVPDAVARDRLRGLRELRPLGLVRVDELAAPLQVQLTAGRPADALLVGAARLWAAQDALELEVAARAQDLLLELAAAVSDDALRLDELAQRGRARQLLIRLARL